MDPGRFGNLAKACFTLFQLITLDDWFFMYSDVRDTYPGEDYSTTHVHAPILSVSSHALQFAFLRTPTYSGLSLIVHSFGNFHIYQVRETSLIDHACHRI